LRNSQYTLVRFINYIMKKLMVGDFMDKKTHELIKTYIKENSGTGTVNLSAPAVWMDAPVKYYFWMTE